MKCICFETRVFFLSNVISYAFAVEEEAHAQVRLLNTHFAPMQPQLGPIVFFNHYCFMSNCLLMFPKAEAQKEKDEAEVQVNCPLLHGCACCRSLQPDWDPARDPGSSSCEARSQWHQHRPEAVELQQLTDAGWPNSIPAGCRAFPLGLSGLFVLDSSTFVICSCLYSD